MHLGSAGVLAGAALFAACACVTVVTSNDDVGWGAILGGVLLYAGLCEIVFTNESVRTTIIGSSSEEPTFLPKAVAFWSLASAGALSAWHYAQGGSTSELVRTKSSFFSVGWRSGLIVVGIPVNHWWIYLVIVLYQLTRAIFGSLVRNIHHPYYQSHTNNPRPMDEAKKHNLLFGQALVNVFHWWSALTDVLFSASQIDLALCTLLVTIASDYAQVHLKIEQAAKGEVVEKKFRRFVM